MCKTHQTITQLGGRCRCGTVKVTLELAQDPPALQPRACQCSYCRSNDGVFVSDPAGRMTVSSAVQPVFEEQGSNSAKMIRCAVCDHFVGAVFEDDGGMVGALTISTLDDRLALREPVAVEPARLTASQKKARWRTLWTPCQIESG